MVKFYQLRKFKVVPFMIWNIESKSLNRSPNWLFMQKLFEEGGLGRKKCHLKGKN